MRDRASPCVGCSERAATVLLNKTPVQSFQLEETDLCPSRFYEVVIVAHKSHQHSDLECSEIFASRIRSWCSACSYCKTIVYRARIMSHTVYICAGKAKWPAEIKGEGQHVMDQQDATKPLSGLWKEPTLAHSLPMGLKAKMGGCHSV